MDFEKINSWKNKKILVIGEALIDKYIKGNANKMSPDAPVPNVKIEKNLAYLGGIGLTMKYIKSLGGIPEICTIIGNDYEGDYFFKKVKELNINTSGILIDENISTPQITRIKAMNQHLLRLETDYSNDISEAIINKFFEGIKAKSQDYDSIVILDYGIGGLFKDLFIQRLLNILNKKFENIPIVARSNVSNYHIYEDVDIIKMTLQKALRALSIDCCTPASISIAGKRILNSAKCKSVFLNDIESDSYLFLKDSEDIFDIKSILQGPVVSYVAVGSVIMSILGLSYATNIPPIDAVKIALFGANLSASTPPVDFFNSEKLINYIQNHLVINK